MSDGEVDEFLEHFGIKGMHWGIRNDKRRDSKSGSAKKPSRKDRKRARLAESQKIAQGFVNTALKDPNVLINLNGRVVVTGKEFVGHLANGGLLDVNRTRIYAQQKKPGGKYVLQ